MQAQSRFQGCQLRFIILHKMPPFMLYLMLSLHLKEMWDQTQIMAIPQWNAHDLDEGIFKYF